MHTIIKILLLIVPLIFINVNIHGQNQHDLETIIIKSDSGKSTIGNNTINIKEEDMLSYNSENIAYALSNHTPAFIKQYGSGSPSSISIRSSLPSHTQIIWNNLKLNSTLYGTIDLSLIPIFFTSNIQIYQGPSSLSYGSGGVAGTIVINGSERVKEGLSIKYLQQLASFYTFGEFLNLSYRKKSIQSSLKIFNKYSKNNFYYKNLSVLDDNYSHPIAQNKNSAYNIYGLLHNISYYIEPYSSLTNDLWMVKANRKIPDNALIEVNNDNNFAKQTDLQIRNALNYKIYKNKIEFISFLALEHQILNFYSQKYVLGAPIIIDNDSYAKTNAVKLGLGINNAQLTKKLYIGNNLSYTLNNALNTNKLKNKTINTGFFDIENTTQLEVKYNQELSLVFVADNIYRNKHYFLHYSGINYLLLPDYDMFLKFGFGSQLRFPTVNDLYFSPGGNPDLLPEHNTGLELSTSMKIKALAVNASIYYSKTDNWVLWMPHGSLYWRPQNIGQVQSQGIEVFLNYTKEIRQIKMTVAGSVNYSVITKNYLNDTLKDKQLPYMPKFSSNFNIAIAYKHSYFKWLFTNYSKRYISLDKTTARDALPTYFMNDIIIGYEVNVKKINILLEIKVLNLFNENYYAVEYMPMPGRNYGLSIITYL